MLKKYKIIKDIGEGVEGIVFAGRNIKTGEKVVIKAIKHYLAGTYCAV